MGLNKFLYTIKGNQVKLLQSKNILKGKRTCLKLNSIKNKFFTFFSRLYQIGSNENWLQGLKCSASISLFITTCKKNLLFYRYSNLFRFQCKVLKIKNDSQISFKNNALKMSLLHFTLLIFKVNVISKNEFKWKLFNY